ncbi:glucose dehydrogenase [FAD, quinone]-like isoform X2 [Bacillus rossius redtenbacheri]
MDATAGCACSFQDTQFLGATCGANYSLFMTTLSLLLSADPVIADPCRRLGRDGARLADVTEVDFVVVGAGATGPVVASRLSEDASWSVLLLEAGPEEPTATELPAFAVSAVGSPLDWNYTTTRQAGACLNTGGVCAWPRGRMVGGTTAMQGMMYTRGNRDIYDRWAALGNTGWDYTSFLHYLKKAEGNRQPRRAEEGYHGFDGPVAVQQFADHPELAEAIVRAAEELGYPSRDLTGSNQTGAAVAFMMVDGSLRVTSPRAYLRPHADRPNLRVAINSHVTKVLIENGTAYGVRFVDSEGRNKTVLARKEVILSGGTIGSAQLLLLSGVGPSEDLSALGIPVVKDLPVGHNLHNHVGASVGFYINDSSTATLTLPAFHEFVQTRSGPMAGTGLTQTTAFMLSKYAEDGVPDLQVFFDGFNAACSRTGVEGECSDGSLGDCGRRYINARPVNVLPRSRGSLRLRSADPRDPPLLDPAYLTDRRDADVVVEGLKTMVRMTRTEALRPWGFELDPTPAQGCGHLSFASDEYWLCAVRQGTGPENHQAGSCRMGPAGDYHAVVDPRLRVHGVGRLRVADASVMPVVVNSNPIPTLFAIGEKAADMIKADWT